MPRWLTSLQRLFRRLAAQLRRTDALPFDADLLAMAAMHMSDSMLLTGIDRRITWCNKSFEKLSGYTLAEARGRTPAELLQFEETDPDTVTKMRDALNAGRNVQCQIRNRGKDGKLFWLELKIEPMRDRAGRLLGFMSLQTDITERLAMKAEIRRSAELMRSAIDVIDEAFVLYDPQDRLVFCNDKYRKVYALSADLLVPGARFVDIIREGARRGQYPAAVGDEEGWVTRRLAIHREGNRALVQRLAGGQVVRIVERTMSDGHHVGFRVDITDLSRATEAAEQADRAKSEFIATISHELRTPLQSILGFSDLGRHFAQNPAEDPRRFAPMFDDIHAGGTRMLHLVNGLLDVSRIDSSHGSLQLRRGDLAAVAAEVARELRQLAAQRRVSLQLPDPMPVVPANLDSFRMQQVVRNLLANAIRYAPEESAIDIGLVDQAEDSVVLTVRDRGPGIPPDELTTVFEPFVQSSRTRDGSGGSGLGLTISRKIVRAHGGHIEATLPDDGGPGACLRVQLPRATCHADSSASTDAAPPAPGGDIRATRSLRSLRNPLTQAPTTAFET